MLPCVGGCGLSVGVGCRRVCNLACISAFIATILCFTPAYTVLAASAARSKPSAPPATWRALAAAGGVSVGVTAAGLAAERAVRESP